MYIFDEFCLVVLADLVLLAFWLFQCMGVDFALSCLDAVHLAVVDDLYLFGWAGISDASLAIVVFRWGHFLLGDLFGRYSLGTQVVVRLVFIFFFLLLLLLRPAPLLLLRRTTFLLLLLRHTLLYVIFNLVQDVRVCLDAVLLEILIILMRLACPRVSADHVEVGFGGMLKFLIFFEGVFFEAVDVPREQLEHVGVLFSILGRPAEGLLGEVNLVPALRTSLFWGCALHLEMYVLLFEINSLALEWFNRQLIYSNCWK